MTDVELLEQQCEVLLALIPLEQASIAAHEALWDALTNVSDESTLVSALEAVDAADIAVAEARKPYRHEVTVSCSSHPPRRQPC